MIKPTDTVKIGQGKRTWYVDQLVEHQGVDYAHLTSTDRADVKTTAEVDRLVKLAEREAELKLRNVAL